MTNRLTNLIISSNSLRSIGGDKKNQGYVQKLISQQLLLTLTTRLQFVFTMSDAHSSSPCLTWSHFPTDMVHLALTVDTVFPKPHHVWPEQKSFVQFIGHAMDAGTVGMVTTDPSSCHSFLSSIQKCLGLDWNKSLHFFGMRKKCTQFGTLCIHVFCCFCAVFCFNKKYKQNCCNSLG